MVFRFLPFVGNALLLGGCSVYAPMQPTVSTVRQVGQLETSASIQVSGRLEAGAVYALQPHLLVAGSGTYRPGFILKDSSYCRTQQWEASVGTYWPLGKSWLLTGLGGYGYARTDQYSPFNSSFNYQARYSKLFGQVAIDYSPQPTWSYGLVYRFTQLHFDELSVRNDYYQSPIGISTMGRHELLLYGRRTLPWGQWGRWQYQGTFGVSFGDRAAMADPVPHSFAANYIGLPVLLVSYGLVYTPTWGRVDGTHAK